MSNDLEHKRLLQKYLKLETLFENDILTLKEKIINTEIKIYGSVTSNIIASGIIGIIGMYVFIEISS